MLVSNRVVRLLVDAAQQHGVSREKLLRPLGRDAEELLADGRRIEWGTMVAVYDELLRLVDNDPERLRRVGRGMRSARSPDIVRDVARGLLGPRGLYRFVDRWMAPGFPHLRLYMRFATSRRVQLHCDVPEPHAGSLAFFYVFEARLASLPEMMGLPPCTIVESRITPRSADLVLDLPEDRAFGAKALRAARAIFAHRRSRAAREEQRRTLAESIEALQRARDELRVLLDRLPDLVAVHTGGKILWTNRAMIEALGYEHVRDVIGSQLIEHVAPRSRADVLARMAQPADLPGTPATSEFHLVSKRGDEVLIEAAPTQAVVFDGVNARMIVARDVTERARLQQELILADRLASIGLLAAGVAHEVNNPLAYVLNNIEIARKITAGLGKDAAVAHDVLGVALEGVDRIGVIVRDLLMLSRGDATLTEAIDLGGVVKSTVALAAREVERTARLVTDIGPAPLVNASEARVAQVLLNLVGNSLEAMRGRERTAGENELRVKVGYADDGRFLLEVSDNGVGIPAAHVGRVFEPFFTTKPAGRGTGLGLSIAQRLVVELGGEISVTSHEGVGTTFRVFLPDASVTRHGSSSIRATSP